jgi:hypothetical protein
MNRFQQLHWPLIIGMGALALIRPFLNIIGVMDLLGRPFGPLAVTALISVAWLVIVVAARVREPIWTLTFTGIVYGIFAFVLGSILSPILTGELSGPIANPFILPFAITGILVTNALWGFVIGLIAWTVQKATRPESQPETN